jgi:hypothetical protein
MDWIEEMRWREPVNKQRFILTRVIRPSETSLETALEIGLLL